MKNKIKSQTQANMKGSIIGGVYFNNTLCSVARKYTLISGFFFRKLNNLEYKLSLTSLTNLTRLTLDFGLNNRNEKIDC